MNEKIIAHPSKEEREKVLKEIQQLENRQKILENKQRNEERRVRTRRLIERGAVFFNNSMAALGEQSDEELKQRIAETLENRQGKRIGL